MNEQGLASPEEVYNAIEQRFKGRFRVAQLEAVADAVRVMRDAPGVMAFWDAHDRVIEAVNVLDKEE